MSLYIYKNIYIFCCYLYLPVLLVLSFSLSVTSALNFFLVCLSVCLSGKSVRLSFYLSFKSVLNFYLDYMSVCRSVCLSLCLLSPPWISSLFVCLPAYLSACLLRLPCLSCLSFLPVFLVCFLYFMSFWISIYFPCSFALSLPLFLPGNMVNIWIMKQILDF